MRAFLALLALSVGIFAQALTWVKQPLLTKNSDTSWTVSFELNRAADVEVAIIDLRDSTILRHLAAGVLGSNPPPPLAPTVLAQNINWNGKDDRGVVTTIPAASLGVRVRAGMSVEWNNMVGNDPYSFTTGGELWWYIKGTVADAEGNLYVYGSSNRSIGFTVRCYDSLGNYKKTVFPFPSSLSNAQVTGHSVNIDGAGKYTIKTGTTRSVLNLSGLVIGGTIFNHSNHAHGLPQMVHMQDNSDLCFVGDINKLCMLKKDGSREGTATQMNLITSPTMNTTNMGETFWLCESQDKQNYYVTGLWELKGSNAVDTGFWRDGQVFKINKTTGAATSVIRLDTIPLTSSLRIARLGAGGTDNWIRYSSFHGVTVDDSGHIFVCDRMNKRIGVYDTTGAYLGGIPLQYAEQVKVHSKTGAIYATTRYASTLSSNNKWIKLYKFNTWRNAPAAVCSTVVTTTVDYYEAQSYLTTIEQGNGALIWVSHLRMPEQAKLFRDGGNTFTYVKGLADASKNYLAGFDRIAVNKKYDIVYVNDGWSKMAQISNWSNPKMSPCSLATGQQIDGMDMAVSHDNQLYVMKGGDCGGQVYRYGLNANGKYSPAKWTNSDSNVLAGLPSRRGSHQGFYGMAIAPDKKVAVYVAPWSTTIKLSSVNLLADSGQNTSLYQTCYPFPKDADTLIKATSSLLIGGFQFDLQGNLYVGASIRSKNHRRPAGYGTDNGYAKGVGSVFKFSAGSLKGGMIQTHGGCCAVDTIAETYSSGYEKLYLTGVGPFSAYEYCSCRTPRFDVDGYGRLFLPNAITQKVAV
ncbi:MAG: hypothetical protein JNL74_10455, partial [Fibrobacteres bacterium]|nr:hypothetical protein [Fibrobacterota bacterium]